MKRIFIKCFGFSEAERHALDTVFRLSGARDMAYSPWTPKTTEPADVLLVDGDSWEAMLALANPAHDGLRLVWVGEDAPEEAWRVFPAPVKWSAVIEALDAEFAQITPRTLSLDLDLAHAQDMDVQLDAEDNTAPMGLDGEPPPTRRVLVVDAARDQRLYLRAKLASVGLCEVDEAASGGEALALLASNAYRLVMLDLGLTDMDGWQVAKAVEAARPAVPRLIVTGTEPAWHSGTRAWFAGAQVYLKKPLVPEKLTRLLQKV